VYPAVDLKKPYANDDAVLALAVELALHSAELKGGPFGAVITDASRKIVSVGVNAVVASQDSTSHAEINAIRQAHKVTGTYDLKEHRLYTSCAPCILCFGAIYWSGIQEVMAAAPKELAEAAGFKEGPVGVDLWAAAQRDKGIVYRVQTPTQIDPGLPFVTFQRLGGELY